MALDRPVSLAQARYRRILGGVGLILAPLCNWIASLLNPLANQSTAAEQLDILAEDAGRAIASAMFDMIGVVFFIPAFLALLHLLAPKSMKLAHVAASLALAGLVGFMGLHVFTLVTAEMVRGGADRQEMIALFERLQDNPGLALAFLLFLFGQVGGLVLFAAGLLTTKMAPLWLPLFILGFVVWDVGFGLAGADPTVARIIEPHMLAFFALGGMGFLVLRQSDTAWVMGDRLGF